MTLFPHRRTFGTAAALVSCVVTAAVASPAERIAGTGTGGEPGRPARAAQRVFLEMSARPAACYVGQEVVVTVRFGFEKTFLEENVLQMFRQPLAVPVHLRVPFLKRDVGVRVLQERREVGRGRLLFALNGAAAHAERTVEARAGRRFVVLERRWRIAARSPGAVALPRPQLQYRFATKFRGDFVRGRIAEDGRDAVVDGDTVTLQVRAVPTAGRPPAFTGAIGRFRVRASAAPRKLTVGGSVKLTLVIEGSGDLLGFDPPPLSGLEALDGFHVRGKLDERSAQARRIVYDLEVVQRVSEVPAIGFAFFDPGEPPRFRTVRTDALPLIVESSAPGADVGHAKAGSAPPTAGENDIFDIKPGAAVPAAPPVGSPVGPPVGSPVVLAAVLLLPWALAFGLRSLWRARRTNRAPERVRARGAAVAFRTDVGAPGADLSALFAEYLSARLHVPLSAVIAPDLPDRLEAAGVESGLARRAANVMHDLTAAKYGGAGGTAGVDAATAGVDAATDVVDAATDVVGALESVFHPKGTKPG